jgi:hypothetical protein
MKNKQEWQKLHSFEWNAVNEISINVIAQAQVPHTVNSGVITITQYYSMQLQRMIDYITMVTSEQVLFQLNICQQLQQASSFRCRMSITKEHVIGIFESLLHFDADKHAGNMLWHPLQS